MRHIPKDDKSFEQEVRNIARQLWPTEIYSGAITIDERERDAIFVTEDVVHYLEITTSKSEKNTIDNIKKITALLPKLQNKYPGRIAKGWYITLYEPTGEQGRHLAECEAPIFHQTYHQFLGRLIDSQNYMSLRQQAPFGSARNTSDNSLNFAKDEYVSVEFRDYATAEPVAYHTFMRRFREQARRSLVTGEFGVGKSMFSRQVFMDLAREHKDGKDFAFPLYINLRDHIDSQYPYICLHAHAKSIGFPNPEHLVRAWRAGYTYLILDGFDELIPTISTKDLKREKEIRRSALELVKRFLDETPPSSSVLVTGRSNFFDTNEDLVDCLGKRASWDNLLLPDFNEKQVEVYLKKKGFRRTLPQWLPSRPLLIGYLVSNDLLPATPNSDNDERDLVVGWRMLIEKIAEREVNQVHIALEPSELIQIYGRIATMCRKKQNSRGPVATADCRAAFVETTGVEPESRSLTALLRLPGLVGPESRVDVDTGQPTTGQRWFVDDNFMNAVAGEDFRRAIQETHAFDISVFKGVKHPLSELGASIALSKIPSTDLPKALLSAFHWATEQDPQSALNIDIFHAFGNAEISTSIGDASIVNYIAQDLLIDADDIDYSGVIFKDCFFEKVVIETTSLDNAPKFYGCLIQKIQTHHPEENVSKILFGGHVENYEATYKNYDQYRNSSDDDKMIAMSSVLNKTFIQSGNGRLESALKRGLNHSQALWVDACTEILRHEGMISPVRRNGATIWVPNTAFTGVVREVLRNPDISSAQFVEEIRKLQRY